MIVDHDSATLAHRKSGGARRSHRAGRMPAENTMTSVSRWVPSANCMRCRCVSPSHDAGRVLADVNADAECGDLLSQDAAAALIDLDRHQARREFDDMRR